MRILIVFCISLVEGSSLLESFQRGLGIEEPKDPSSLYEGRKLQADGLFEASQPLLADTFGGEPGFYHSVASGDPLTDAVIIWCVVLACCQGFRTLTISSQDSLYTGFG